MGTYALRRVIQMIPLLLVISLLIFALTALQPGDPVDQLVFGNSNITPDDIARLKAAYGLDQPWFTRYFFWLKQAVTGNFGYSQDFGIPALDFVFQSRLPNTLLLTVPALIISTLIAVPLGIFSAVRQYSPLDYILTFFAFLAVSARCSGWAPWPCTSSPSTSRRSPVERCRCRPADWAATSRRKPDGGRCSPTN
ncbi:ABC transporter permease [Deinococcus sp. JMULE3]|uniref:ABC transporter permease n=1 Tax=Deinococcus sp. JMULE3 TaxID=2518341 RepID=UPI0035304061